MIGAKFRIQIPGRDVEEIRLVRRKEQRSDEEQQEEEEERVTLDGQSCSLFFAALKTENGPRVFLNYLRRKRGRCSRSVVTVVVVVDVSEPEEVMLDRRGGEMLERSALERRELDNALAWFSTLGGAFSALGDRAAKCAVIAGRISLQQLRFALRLGDPNLQSRCRLYTALSLLQQKHFAAARQILRNEFTFATTLFVPDPKLVSMCRGIWAKWKYERGLARQAAHQLVRGKAISL